MLKKNKFSLKNIKIIIFIFLSLMLVYVKITFALNVQIVINL